MTEQDAARLAEIRAEYHGEYSRVRFLLRLLDAKPAGEFVTKAWHNARVVEVTVDMAERMAAAEARVEIERGRLDYWRDHAADAEAERDRLAASLAAAEAALRAIADCPATMAPGMVWQDVADRMARYAREALQGQST